MARKIEKRGEHSYRLTVFAGYDGNGKQIIHRKTVNAANDTEAKKLYTQFAADVERGNIAASGKMTLKEFFAYWEEHHARNHHEPKTIIRNKELFSRIEAALGSKRLDKLEPKHILQFYKKLSEPGIKNTPTKKNGEPAKRELSLSANTIQKHHKLLSALLTKAVQWGFIYSNPCSRVESPKATRQQIPILDEEQTIGFLALLDGEELKYRLLVFIALSTGLRRGEIFGLRWANIDFVKKTFDIRETSQYITGVGLITKSPKNESSRRQIAVSDSVMELLRQHKAEQSARRLKLGAGDGGEWVGAQKSEEDFVFTTWNGAPMHPDSFNNWLRKFIDEHKLTHISPHSFRHMSATFALVQGISLKSVSARLGHSKTSTTADIYSHALKSVDRDIAEKMDAFLTSSRVKKGQS